MNENKQPFKYKNAILTFQWNEPDEQMSETTVKITWQFVVRKTGDVETHSYNRTTAQMEAFYLPLLRVILGYDSMSNALLYVNDEHSKNIYLRLLEQGTDFISVKGLKLDKDTNKWSIE